jgi:FkbM family methyltransferase
MDSIKNIIKQKFIKFLPKFASREITKKYILENINPYIYYSQEGEDIVLQRFLQEKEKGFYIDIGAHHPTRFSNTYLLYLKGWRGVNIDAMPGSMELFNELRPEDINIEVPVSDESKEMLFYIFKETALNTFDETLANTYIAKGWKLLKKRKVVTQTVKDILKQHSISAEIDLMTIDVEGHELQVLRSIDWLVCNPTFILIEDLNFDLNHLMENELYTFMINKQYQMVAKTVHTVFFKKA